MRHYRLYDRYKLLAVAVKQQPDPKLVERMEGKPADAVAFKRSLAKSGAAGIRVVWDDGTERVAAIGRTSLRKSQDDNAKVRWITLHDKEGHGTIHVKIRESTTQAGVFHIISGPKGLHYLRLTNIKSPEEYAKQAAAKAKDKPRATPDGKKPHDTHAEIEAKKAAIRAVATHVNATLPGRARVRRGY